MAGTGSEKPQERFDGLVQREGEGLFRFLFWSLRREEDAKDALQEVLLRAHRGLSGFRGEGSIKKWLFAIATNVLNDAHVKRKKTPPTYGTDPIESAAPTAPPGKELEDREMSERLQTALSRLSPELREPLLLHTLSGMKYREVADALKLPIGTVTSRIHAARMKLQELLGDEA